MPLVHLLDTGEVSFSFVKNLAKLLSHARQFWRLKIRDEEDKLDSIEDQFLETLDLMSAIPVIKRIVFETMDRKDIAA